MTGRERWVDVEVVVVVEIEAEIEFWVRWREKACFGVLECVPYIEKYCLLLVVLVGCG